MNSNKYDHSCKWWVHQTEHPKVQGQNLGWKHTKAKEYTEDTLCKPGIRWKPLDGATAGYTNFSTNYDTEYAQRSGALFFYLAKEDVEVNLTAFIINFPDYGEKVDSNDNLTKYRKRSRNSGNMFKIIFFLNCICVYHFSLLILNSKRNETYFAIRQFSN